MADSKIEILSVDLLVTNAGTQMRAKVDDDTVEQYYDLWRAKHEFPPLDVFSDGETFWVADGFHRLYGAQKAKRGSLPCRIHKGTLRDAILFACGANHDHGLHRSRADKRTAVEALLDDEEWGKRSQTWIAEQCRVGKQFVATVIADRKPSVLAQPPNGAGGKSPSSTVGGTDTRQRVEGRDGKTYPATRPPAAATSSPVETDIEADLGKCPNCGGNKWVDDEFGFVCAKCHQPHGEPVGDADESRVNDQRLRTVKTAEALMRAFDDLNRMMAKAEHVEAIASCKFLLKTAKDWK